jgi:hypothetical protein
MELSPRSKQLLRVYDPDTFRRLLPGRFSGGTTDTGTLENSPQLLDKAPTGRLKPNYPMRRVEAEDGRGEPVTVVVSSFNILPEDSVRPISLHKRSSSRRQSARVHESKRRRLNRSAEIDKTEFEPPQKSSAGQSKRPSASQERTKPAAADQGRTKKAAVDKEQPRKSLRGVAEGSNAVVGKVIEGTRIPIKDFIDISMNRGRVKTKTGFSISQISNYKATFPESAKTSYFIKPGEPPGLKSQSLLMTQLSTTTTASHTWVRHASRMRVQSMGTMSPAIVSYPLDEELPRSHLRKTSTELIL